MTSPEANGELFPFITACCRALDDKKAIDMRVLDVRGKSTVTDYLILASGTSEPHLRALRGVLEQTIKEQKVPLVGIDENPTSGWLVVDAFDVMIHLFLPQQRSEYQLELLWKDAKDVNIPRLTR
jgi:ribosome-associated protein